MELHAQGTTLALHRDFTWTHKEQHSGIFLIANQGFVIILDYYCSLTLRCQRKSSHIKQKYFFFSPMTFSAPTTPPSLHLRLRKQKELTWFRRWKGVPSTGMSVRAVRLSAFCIVFTVWMDEQALISKLTVGKNSE